MKSAAERLTECGVTVAEVQAGIADAKHTLAQVQPALDAGLIEFDPMTGDLIRKEH